MPSVVKAFDLLAERHGPRRLRAPNLIAHEILRHPTLARGSIPLQIHAIPEAFECESAASREILRTPSKRPCLARKLPVWSRSTQAHDLNRGRPPLFESDFLTNSSESKDRYRDLLSRAAGVIANSLPPQPYAGKTPAELAGMITNDFLPNVAHSPDKIADTLRAIVTNSINVTHPHTAAHLHCPPLLASLGGRGCHLRSKSVHGLVRPGSDRNDRRTEDDPLAMRGGRPARHRRRHLHHRRLPIQLHGPAAGAGHISQTPMELVRAEIRPAARSSSTSHFVLRGLAFHSREVRVTIGTGDRRGRPRRGG